MKRWGHLQNSKKYYLPGEKNKKTTLSVEDREQIVQRALSSVFNNKELKGFSVLVGAQESQPSPTPTPTPSYTPTLTPTPTTPAWNPSQLTNLYEWWTNTSGISTTGSEVDSWTGYNGRVFTPQNSGYKPQYNSSDSDWNTLPSVLINPTSVIGTPVGLTSTASSGSTSKTMIVVSRTLSYPNPSLDYTGFFTIGTDQGNPRFSLLFKPNTNQYDGFNIQTVNEVIFGSVSLPQYTNSFISYDYTTGQYTYSVSTTINSINGVSVNDNSSPGYSWAQPNLAVGSYTINNGNAGLLTSPKMSVVEVIVVDGILTPTEVSNLNTFLTNKYLAPVIPTPTPTPSATPTLTPSSGAIFNNILTEGSDNIQGENGVYIQYEY